MNVLMGKTTSNGEILINGNKIAPKTISKLTGFVPQDDIMLRELTTREILLHSARCRLPSNFSTLEIESHVDSILNALDLVRVSHSIVGDETVRGISGGQRKRVNIGIELAAVPMALFLDEPTRLVYFKDFSGLDSSSALIVAELLKGIASLGITVVAVIHQPRFEIFQTFDDIILLSQGGRLAYMGQAELAKDYFANLGYKFEEGLNPADVFMDILSGTGIGMSRTPIELSEKWKELKPPKKIEATHQVKFEKDVAVLIKYRASSPFKQVWWCFTRSIKQQSRTFISFVLEIFVASVAGALMGVSVGGANGELYKGLYVFPYSLVSPSPLSYVVTLYAVFLLLTKLLIGFSVSLAGAPAGVKVFGEVSTTIMQEKPVFWRETASGHWSFSYYLGKTLAATPRFTLSSLHFASIYQFLAAPTFPRFGMTYALIFFNFFGIYGQSAFVSTLVRRENSNLVAVIASIFTAVLCGFASYFTPASDLRLLKPKHGE